VRGDGPVLRSVTATDNARAGIEVHASHNQVTVDDSVANRNGGDGIKIVAKSGMTCSRNQANDNGGSGMRIKRRATAGNTTIATNQTDTNAAYGIWLTGNGDSPYGSAQGFINHGNTATGNALGAFRTE
jgi:parallel beta-helix repeat protein